MSKINYNDRNQASMQVLCLDELIDENNPVRGIDFFVESLNFDALNFKVFKEGLKGQQPYNRKDLLKLHIYGYLNGIKSSRKLERECKRNIELMWLINSIKPDHGTISLFLKENAKSFKLIMRSLTLDLKQFGLIDLTLLVIDGTKIRAQNSKNNTISKTSIDKKMIYVDEKISEYINQLDNECIDDAEKIQEKLKHYKNLKATYVAQTQILEDEKIETKALNDPDSRKMKNHGSLEMCYNVQSVVESKNHFILELNTTNDINDENQLYEMASETRNSFCEDDSEINVLADTGYYNCQDIKKCIDSGMKVIIKKAKPNSSTDSSEYKKDKFTYDEVNDEYQCPKGRKLAFFENTSKNDQKYKRYKCQECHNCPSKAECTTSKTGRTIQRWEHESILDDVQAYTKLNNNVYYTRRAIVEHPFGYFKRSLGFTYFNRKGKDNVEIETQLMGIAYNLRRIFSMLSVKDFKKLTELKIV